MAGDTRLRRARVLLLAPGRAGGDELTEGARRLARAPRRIRLLAVAAVVGLALHCAGEPESAGGAKAAVAAQQPTPADDGPLQLRARVVGRFPHDPEASTQGLEWFDGHLYESTGLWGASSLRRVALASGAVQRRVDLDSNLFGEGLTRVGRTLLQLTWQNERAIRYDVASFEVLGEYPYRGEGWGLCFDGVDLWRSDGSDRLRRHDVETFVELDSLPVSDRGRPVYQLNELECAEGWIYANVWQSETIVRIAPASGRVMAVIDASDLLSASERAGAGVLNGIAYREDAGTFLLTGKKWPRLFEVVFVERSD